MFLGVVFVSVFVKNILSSQSWEIGSPIGGALCVCVCACVRACVCVCVCMFVGVYVSGCLYICVCEKHSVKPVLGDWQSLYTGGAGKMKLSCVVPASVIHI